MRGIFISYRRADSAVASRAIYDQLQARFRWVEVFKDVDAIPPGRDFVQVLDRALAQSSMLVAVVGPQWATIADESGRRRLDNPADFVRLEVEIAFRRGIPIVLALVDGAARPDPRQLPPSLASLAQCPAVSVGKGATFQSDMDRLMDAMVRMKPTLARWRPTHPILAAIAGGIMVVVYGAQIPYYALLVSRSGTAVVFGSLLLVAALVSVGPVIYTLFKLAQWNRWGWFTAMLTVGSLTGGLMLLIFGLVGPKGARQRGFDAADWSGFYGPPRPPADPAVRLGLIFAAIAAVISLLISGTEQTLSWNSSVDPAIAYHIATWGTSILCGVLALFVGLRAASRSGRIVSATLAAVGPSVAAMVVRLLVVVGFDWFEIDRYLGENPVGLYWRGFPIPVIEAVAIGVVAGVTGALIGRRAYRLRAGAAGAAVPAMQMSSGKR